MTLLKFPTYRFSNTLEVAITTLFVSVCSVPYQECPELRGRFTCIARAITTHLILTWPSSTGTLYSRINQSTDVGRYLKRSTIIENHIPHKFIKPGARNGPPWTRYKSINKAKRQRRRKWVTYRTSKLESDKILYEHESLNVLKSLSFANAHYENKIIDQIKDDPKRFWNYTRHFSRSSSTIYMLIDEGEKDTDDSAKAKILNEYFISVLTQEPEVLGTLPDVVDANPQHLLEDFTILSSTLRKKWTRLKANRASGPDQISVNVLRNCPNFFIPLTILFNNSVQTGTLPQDWRDAHFSHIHKKGSRTNCGNYRPVSLTSQIVKLLERVFQDHLLKHISRNKTISCHQHGFQSRCSCVTNWGVCQGPISHNNEQTQSVEGII